MHPGEHGVENKDSKRRMTQEEAELFARDARYTTPESFRYSCCVDGREEGADASRAVPGADAGYFMSALAALRESGVEVTPEVRRAVFGAVIDSVGGPKNIRFHTDLHALEKAKEKGVVAGVAAGCGHLNLARQNPGVYGVTAEDMSAIDEELLRLLGEDADQKTLPGNHGEEAVMVVDDVSVGLRHQAAGSQAFVYHKGSSDAFLDQLAGAVLAKLPNHQPGLTEEALRVKLGASFDRQLTATVNSLAPGLPQYRVSGEEVSYLGDVPKKE